MAALRRTITLRPVVGRVMLAATYFVLTSCSPADADQAATKASSTTVPATTEGTLAPPTSGADSVLPSVTTESIPPDWRVVVSPSGVVLPIVGYTQIGHLVSTPCANEVLFSDGEFVSQVDIVLDPGHGGKDEPGAVGGNGVIEAEVNLDVARRLRDLLEADGYSVLLTREGDYRLPIVSRAEIVEAVTPRLVVSVHHNSGGAAPSNSPGSTVFFQSSDQESKRLAGIIWEESMKEFIPYSIEWFSGSTAGVIYRLNRDEEDFYGMLRRTAGTPTALTELAYLDSPVEAALLATDQFRDTEAEVLERGILRWLNTDDPGGGYKEPPFLGFNGGTSGQLAGCVDPDLIEADQ